MKLFFCLLLFFVTANVKAQTDDKATLRHIKEVEWPRAYRQQDTVLLDKILADEFKMIGSAGEDSDKADQIQDIRTHKPNYISFKFQIKRWKYLKTEPQSCQEQALSIARMNRENIILSINPQMS